MASMANSQAIAFDESKLCVSYQIGITWINAPSGAKITFQNPITQLASFSLSTTNGSYLILQLIHIVFSPVPIAVNKSFRIFVNLLINIQLLGTKWLYFLPTQDQNYDAYMFNSGNQFLYGNTYTGPAPCTSMSCIVLTI